MTEETGFNLDKENFQIAFAMRNFLNKTDFKHDASLVEWEVEVWEFDLKKGDHIA